MAGLLTRVARSDSRMTADRAQRDKFVARKVGLPRVVTTAFFHARETPGSLVPLQGARADTLDTAPASEDIPPLQTD